MVSEALVVIFGIYIKNAAQWRGREPLEPSGRPFHVDLLQVWLLRSFPADYGMRADCRMRGSVSKNGSLEDSLRITECRRIAECTDYGMRIAFRRLGTIQEWVDWEIVKSSSHAFRVAWLQTQSQFKFNRSAHSAGPTRQVCLL